MHIDYATKLKMTKRIKMELHYHIIKLNGVHTKKEQVHTSFDSVYQ